MRTELFYLALVATFTALMWIPYVLNRFAVWGINDTVGYPDNPKPLAPWAERLKRAHANAVENLVVFATLVLVVFGYPFRYSLFDFDLVGLLFDVGLFIAVVHPQSREHQRIWFT